MAVRSDVWEFFDKVGASEAKCRLCSKRLAWHGGTSSLRTHLSGQHPLQYKRKDDDNSKKQPPITSCFSAVSPKPCSADRAKTITDLIAAVVYGDIRPAAIVSGKHFQALMAYLEPSYRVPSDRHIMELVKKKYLLLRSELEGFLHPLDCNFSLTSDIWTSSANDAYLSVTAHFITNDWAMKSVILDILPFPVQHTGINIAVALQEIVKSYSIASSKVLAFVHDEGSNMQVAARELATQLHCYSISCAGHRLQLCINEGLSIPVLTKVIAASRRLVGHFKHSSRATAELVKKQESMQMPEPFKKLIQDCPTRWNSTFYMVERLLDLRWPISAVLSDESITPRKDRDLDLTSSQWLLLKDLKKVLQPLELATQVFSAEQLPSLSIVYPVLIAILSKLTVDASDSATLKKFKETVSVAIKRRWELDAIEFDDPLLLSAAADPRFLALKGVPTTMKDALVEEMVTACKRVKLQSFPQSSARQKSATRGAMSMLLDSDEEGNNEESQETEQGCSAEDEVKAYFAEKPPSKDSNPLVWWKANCQHFPRMAKVARHMLAIPATSTSSERLFSTAGLTVTKLRSCLKPENVQAIAYLNKNIDF